MRILLFGANGQVGRETVAAAAAQNLGLTSVDRTTCDLAAPGRCANIIERHQPDCVINAAAYTAVDRAEEETDLARRINSDAVGEMASAAAKTGARFIHISTDYVFDGGATAPITEETDVNPLNAYGATKHAGELAARSAYWDSIIIRTSWVYSTHGANFVKTMLRLGATHDALSIVDDQIGGPTPARAIAETVLKIATNDADAQTGGVYHFQGAPAVSWAEFAEAIFAAAGLATKVDRIPTASYPTPAKRPLYTVLDCGKIAQTFGVIQPDWRADLANTAKSIQADQNTAEGSPS